MRIQTVDITNYRSLGRALINFDEVTTFIGPNGSGKSSILRALDWFFNGSKGSLTEDDVFAGAKDDRAISVGVTFGELTEYDREALGQKYAPPAVETLTVVKTWSDGTEKTTGKALAYEGFERVRLAQGATAKREALSEAQDARPDLELPKWTRADAIEEAMSVWESDHPNELSPAFVSDTHFFGFNSEAKMSGLFDYVFVAADMRASEESQDSRGTVIGRILEAAIDRSAADNAISDLVAAFTQEQDRIYASHIAGQLDQLAEELSGELDTLTSGRSVRLRPTNGEIKPLPVKVGISITNAGVETAVSHQGHGFQRALLVSALKLLAQHRRKGNLDPGVICLAIEEPELFQHPTQARAFAAVLRELASGKDARSQIVYATHSPYFIEPRYFDQVRRVSRTVVDSGIPTVTISSASLASTVEILRGFVNERAIMSRWDQACLKSLPEALFAEAVILVEGDDDMAILEGASIASGGNLAAKGIAVASGHGKGTMLVPHAILDQLGIHTLLIFDNDRGCRERMTRNGVKELDIEASELSTIDQNRKILRYFGLPEQDWPEGVLCPRVVAVPDMIESMLSIDWPEWESQRKQIIKEGRGTGGKNAATYGLAASECDCPPQGDLASIVSAVLAL